MHKIITVFVLWALLPFAGCGIGEGPVIEPDVDAAVVDSAPPPDDVEYPQFRDMVAPLLDAKCARCHGSGIAPVFLAATPAESYDLIMEGYPGGTLVTSTREDSRIWAKAQAEHAKEMWTSEESGAIGDWIDAEAVARSM